ncbi:hypothetical protein D3C85_1355550 [compost metagenome]
MRPGSVTSAGSEKVGCHWVVVVRASGVPAAWTTVVGKRRATSQVVVVTVPLKSVSLVMRPLASWMRELASAPPSPDGELALMTASFPWVVLYL